MLKLIQITKGSRTRAETDLDPIRNPTNAFGTQWFWWVLDTQSLN